MEMNFMSYDPQGSYVNFFDDNCDFDASPLQDDAQYPQEIVQNNFECFNLVNVKEADYGEKIVENFQIEEKEVVEVQKYDEDRSIFDDQQNEMGNEDFVDDEPEPHKFIKSDDKSTNLIQNLIVKKEVVPLQQKQKKDIEVEKFKNVHPPEQVETKNLPNYYFRSIIKYSRCKLQESDASEQVKQEWSKKLQKYDKKNKSFTLKTLRELLEDKEISKQGAEYFTSYQFLDDLLNSEKQQDVRPPIKYLNKIYSGCLDKSALQCWKDA